MANNRILLKKSSVPNKVPGASDIEFGEVALNFSDGRLYFKNSDNNIDFFQSGIDGKTPLPFAANEADFGDVSSGPNYLFDLGNTLDEEFFTHDLGTLETDESSIEIFEEDSDLGPVALSVEEEYDLGSVTELTGTNYDLGSIVTGGIVFPNALVLPSFTVENLPEGITGQMLLVTNEVSGTVPAFFDGSNWKRLSDNQTVSTN